MNNSSDDEQEINYNILYENTKEDINYYDENLPHINFYLKFQESYVIENIFSEFKYIEENELKNIYNDLNNVENIEDKNEYNEITKNEEILDVNENDNITNIDINLLNESGFIINELSDEDLNTENILNETNKNLEIKENKNENKNENELYKYIKSQILNKNNIHFDEHNEYTKIMNLIFQKHKEKFIFSIERNIIKKKKEEEEEKDLLNKKIENNKTKNINKIKDKIIENKYKCFLCNLKKKKYIKVLIDIDIYICYTCKSLDSNFRMISLSKLIQTYCLNKNDILKYENKLAFISTDNPRGYSKQMKLYYLFQIKEIAIRKHGSLENVKNIHDEKIFKGKRKRNSDKTMYKFKKTKNFYNKEKQIINTKKIICDENEHVFYPSICINEKDNMYQKNCIKCNFSVQYMEI